MRTVSYYTLLLLFVPLLFLALSYLPSPSVLSLDLYAIGPQKKLVRIEGDFQSFCGNSLEEKLDMSQHQLKSARRKSFEEHAFTNEYGDAVNIDGTTAYGSISNDNENMIGVAPRKRQSLRMEFFQDHIHQNEDVDAVEAVHKNGWRSSKMKFFEEQIFENKNADAVEVEDNAILKNRSVENPKITDVFPTSKSRKRKLVHASNSKTAKRSSMTARNVGDGKLICDEAVELSENFIDAVPVTVSCQKRKYVCSLSGRQAQGSSSGLQTIDNEVDIVDEMNKRDENLAAANHCSCGQSFYQKKRKAINIQYNDAGDEEYQCIHCNANFWLGEANKRKSKRAPVVYTECCQKGRVKLEQLRPTPTLLERYLNPNNGRESMLF